MRSLIVDNNDMVEANSIGSKLKAVRLAKKLSQMDIERRSKQLYEQGAVPAKITHSYLSEIESNKSQGISLDIFQTLTVILEIDPYDIGITFGKDKEPGELTHSGKVLYLPDNFPDHLLPYLLEQARLMGIGYEVEQNAKNQMRNVLFEQLKQRDNR